MHWPTLRGRTQVSCNSDATRRSSVSMSQREREDDRNDRTWKRIDDPVNDLESDARSFRLDEDLYGE